MSTTVFETTTSLSTPDTLISLGAALLLGLYLSFVYIFSDKEKKYSQNFAVTLVILPVCVAAVIMLIGSDIAKAISQTSAKSNPVDLKFIADSLQKYSKFFVTSVNKSWVNHRYEEWKKIKNEDNPQINNDKDSAEFLKTFWSTCSEAWWTKEYAQNLEKALPDNSAKQIIKIAYQYSLCTTSNASA